MSYALHFWDQAGGKSKLIEQEKIKNGSSQLFLRDDEFMN